MTIAEHVGVAVRERDDVAGGQGNASAALQLGDIDQAREIDCADTSLKLPSCFELVVGEHQVGPFPKKYKIYGSYYMNDLVISEIKIYVASTLE
jgi:hypothetical protein